MPVVKKNSDLIILLLLVLVLILLLVIFTDMHVAKINREIRTADSTAGAISDSPFKILNQNNTV